MITPVKLFRSFNEWTKFLQEDAGYGVKASFDPKSPTLERNYYLQHYQGYTQQITEGNKGKLYLNFDIGDYMINHEFRIVHSKRFKRPMDFNLKTIDGYEVKKADIPPHTWFIIDDGKLRKLKTSHSNIGYDEYSFDMEDSFEIYVCDRATRKANKEMFAEIVSKRVLTNALLQNTDYSEYFTPWNNGQEPQFKFLQDLTKLEFEEAVDKYPTYFEVYFKLTDRIKITQEEHLSITRQINSAAGSTYSFIDKLKKFEDDYVKKRNPIKVDYLEVV